MNPTPSHRSVAALMDRVLDDPWSLDLEDRLAFVRSMASAQKTWLERLPALVEPPTPTENFPACLLATERYETLRAAVGDARCRTDLDTGTADELQRFVDHFRGWLDFALVRS